MIRAGSMVRIITRSTANSMSYQNGVNGILLEGGTFRGTLELFGAVSLDWQRTMYLGRVLEDLQIVAGQTPQDWLMFVRDFQTGVTYGEEFLMAINYSSEPLHSAGIHSTSYPRSN